MPSNSRGARGAAKTPTFCSRVERALGESDDFLTPKDLRELLPDISTHDMHVVLHHLRNYKAVAFLQEGGKTFWYRTPESDTRLRTVAEKVMNGPGSRGGKPKRVRTTASPSPAAEATHEAPAPPPGSWTRIPAGMSLNEAAEAVRGMSVSQAAAFYTPTTTKEPS